MLAQLHSTLLIKSNYVVDIGASTGVSYDPVFPFITNTEYRGLCIEGDTGKIAELQNNISPSFDIHNGYITPNNVLDIFAKYNVPKDLDILKIDIDGYDLDVLRVVLSEYSPKILITEINEKIPPPVHFEIPYRENYEWDNSHCFGFSLQAGHSVVSQHGLSILDIHEINNMVCIRSELVDQLNLTIPTSLPELYRARYINNPERHSFHWNESVNHWLNISDPNELCSEIRTYFETKNERSLWPVKTKEHVTEFLCRV